VVAVDALLEPHGCQLPVSFPDPAATVGELYLLYCELVQRPRAAGDGNAGDPGDSAPADAPGRLRGATVRLRPVRPDDLATLYHLVIEDEAIGFGWRFHGALPTPEVFQAVLDRDVLAQHVVTDRGTQEVVGLLTAFAPNLHSGTAHLAMFLGERARRTRRAGEAFGLFVTHLFSTYPLRKLYLEVPAFVLPAYQSAARQDLFVCEGRRREVHYWEGRYWDEVILTLDRARALAAWQRLRDALLPRHGPGPATLAPAGNEPLVFPGPWDR
jgi:RimJ/RimL family protein N-acetyltransferase